MLRLAYSVPTPSEALLKWLPVMFGIVLMYGPMYLRLAGGMWQSEEYAHGPIVLALCLWLVWKNRAACRDLAAPEAAAEVLGWASLAIGLFAFGLGRVLGLTILEVASQIPVYFGVLLILFGWPGVRRFWIVLAFMLFLIPLPGFVIDGATRALKQEVSVIVEHLLYWLGYPVAREGVILSVGTYRLEVANACSGLNSMYSLTAIGVLYIYLLSNGSWVRNAILLLSIWPLAFAANILRVVLLVLITYHFGDAAGQGFFHGFAGILLFTIALGGMFALDVAVKKAIPGPWGGG